ncbi:Transcription factor 25-like protein, partial [Dinothrombium tinctorium]
IMSLRVIRKLKGNDNEIGDKPEQSAEESGSESEAENGLKAKSANAKKKFAVNRFELLNNITNSYSDTEAKEDDDNDQESPNNVKMSGNELESEKHTLEKQSSVDSLKRTKKKKKKVRNQKSAENQLNSPRDDIEASIEEVNQLLGDQSTNKKLSETMLQDTSSKHHKNLLCVETRHLNPENEMKRIFGSKTVQSEQISAHRRKGRGRIAVHKTWTLANPKNWQTIGKPPMSMQHINTVGEGNNKEMFFTFIHTKAYQSIQFQFLDAVESYNPENLMSLLNAYPYHIDTLIQFSDVCRMGEDNQMAAELIERALFCFECVFHPAFNITQGNCRLDYKRPENRSFYIAIFKHILSIGQRGCNRTALEFCKLLLGLDPIGDPLCVIQMIDFYAIRAEQFDYLFSLYNEWSNSRKLWLLPNFRFSIALSYFLKSQLPSIKDSTELLLTSDKYIQEAFLSFPEVLLPLLDKCSVEPDSEVLKCQHFIKSKNSYQSLQHLIAVFIGRNYMVWKERSILAWLERNVREVISRVKSGDQLISDFDEKKKQFFSQATPKNVLRHIFLSGIKEASGILPPDVTNTPVFAFDPFPPSDSIISYSRPQSHSRPSQSGDQSLLSLFLRSWLPDFNVDNSSQGAVGGQAANVERRANNVRRDPAETNDLRRSVTSLLDAMRDLLNNIDMADIPNEGDVDESDEDRNR